MKDVKRDGGMKWFPTKVDLDMEKSLGSFFFFFFFKS